MPIPASWADKLLGLLRIVLGLGFLEHGTQKFFNFPAPKQPMHLDMMLTVGGALELVGGALILIGLFTRFTAFILSGEMAVAYFMFHFPQGPFPATNGGDAAMLYCFAFLYLAAAGGGAFSADRAMGKG
jgi:putative oxidoreductase